ncbi:MAG TPA: hypothetical protein VEI01_26530 [Terriglobales bacterium]|nr:hypothetical protein [Terriglobales bacterium]
MAELAQAAAVLAGFEDRTRHKIALRLLPFLFLLYIVNFVDEPWVCRDRDGARPRVWSRGWDFCLVWEICG